MRRLILFSIIVTTLFCASAKAYDWSTNPGDGSPENPYQISTPEQLTSISPDAYADGHFVLVNDLDLSEYSFNGAIIAGVPFNGTFDGKCFTIRNLTIENYWRGGHYSGLFGNIGNEGVVKNVRIENVAIAAVTANCVGGLCGLNTGKIENCCVTGTIFGSRDSKGGLCGSNGGSIVNCYSAAVVYGYSYVGGLCGDNCGSIVNSYSTGAVTGTGDVGGLCGCSGLGSFIKDCYATGEVSGQVCVGGLCGNNSYGTITNCYATANTRGFSCVGGLCGNNYSSGTITDCYASGLTRGDGNGIGGLCGANSESSTIERCYATGSISGLSAVGGLCGINGANSTIAFCYATGTTSGDGYSVGGLCGESYSGFIEYCYSTSATNGGTEVGGLCGLNAYGSITYCYSAGIVSGRVNVGAFCGLNIQTVARCYFLQGTGPNNSVGSPLIDAEMKQQSKFTGWDFVKETENGTEDIWWIDEGNDYPRLWWEFSNTAPIAEANDITAFAWVDGFVEVRLDGRKSHDEDGDALTYNWYNDANELIAMGTEPNLIFGVGEYDIKLIVNDGIENSEPNYCKVTVIAPFEAPAKMLPQTINLAAKKPVVKGRLEFTQEPRLDPSQPMLLLIGDLEIAAASQRLEYSPEDNKWYFTGQFDLASIKSIFAGDVEIKLVSRFNSGQWVYGEDKIKILQK